MIDDGASASTCRKQMKYVSYVTSETTDVLVGRLDGTDVIDLGFDGDMVSFIASGAPQGHERLVPNAQLVAPLRPPVLRDFLTFEGHLRNAFAGLGKDIPDEWFTVPAYYKGIPSTVIGPDTVIPWPSYSDRLDHELEIAAIIGRPGRNISAAEGLDHVFGFTLWNDFSARDVQTRELPVGMGPAKAKDWDGSNILGPYIVTVDEVDAGQIEAEVVVNGQRWGADSTANMRFSFGELIAYASRDQTLHPGEILGSGTMAGGSGIELDRWLQPGDLIELRSPQLGVLTNTVGAKPSGTPVPIEVVRDRSAPA
ncbi:2-keto-4-pentenoate hydratase/2-oxohepta-3-ene-1,7-dioic acid hydratase in catechol pathway [Ilumatobacter fluminis]|uniref:2-keto-4-pentenoate hydratase/2-oxohepta-3-ene-1,7-dioic acid hydratase in catechol pathway n=1 Tax=Ilumatobacter fluminis TaxID=467091 RepID=A0A4R7HWI3_9ACTN|nr:fumarylacetoacetate hydrolase family protein [Ilumatobacter fluminis]TDT14904.1 2-keto-4-pentenoate hydratase/2-oxohepta-3-ene-1,7-dioic acid hydratase in catechol pathway [Ilumatobacter fluminis]